MPGYTASMGFFDWLRGGGRKSVGKGGIRLEWSGLTTAPSDGDERGADWARVEALLQRFLAEPPTSDAFFILGASEMTYLQGVWEEGAIHLEHQQGSMDRHFECTQPVDRGLLLDLARLFVDNPASIEAAASWAPMEL